MDPARHTAGKLTCQNILTPNKQLTLTLTLRKFEIRKTKVQFIQIQLIRYFLKENHS